MFGASLLKIVKFGAISGTELGVLLVGMAARLGVSILAIRFLMGYIRKHDFTGIWLVSHRPRPFSCCCTFM